MDSGSTRESGEKVSDEDLFGFLGLFFVVGLVAGFFGSVAFFSLQPASAFGDLNRLVAVEDAVYTCQFDSVTGKRYCIPNDVLLLQRLVQDENVFSGALVNHEQRLQAIEALK